LLMVDHTLNLRQWCARAKIFKESLCTPVHIDRVVKVGLIAQLVGEDLVWLTPPLTTTEKVMDQIFLIFGQALK